MKDKKHGLKKKPGLIIKSLKSPFLLVEEAAIYLRMDKRTLDNHRVNNTGPRYRRHGGRICYHIKDLNFWSGKNDCGSNFGNT